MLQKMKKTTKKLNSSSSASDIIKNCKTKQNCSVFHGSNSFMLINHSSLKAVEIIIQSETRLQKQVEHQAALRQDILQIT